MIISLIISINLSFERFKKQKFQFAVAIFFLINEEIIPAQSAFQYFVV